MLARIRGVLASVDAREGAKQRGNGSGKVTKARRSTSANRQREACRTKRGVCRPLSDGRVVSVDGDCCLAGLRATAVLRDGTSVCVRAIRPDDKERLRIAFARLSARSVYQRFFHPVNELTADDLRRLTEIDFRDHVGIVLTGRSRKRRTLDRRRPLRSGGPRRGRGRGRVHCGRRLSTSWRGDTAPARARRYRTGARCPQVRRARARRQPTDARGISAFEAAVTGVVRRWGSPCGLESGRRGTRKSATPPSFLRLPQRNPEAISTIS